MFFGLLCFFLYMSYIGRGDWGFEIIFVVDVGGMEGRIGLNESIKGLKVLSQNVETRGSQVDFPLLTLRQYHVLCLHALASFQSKNSNRISRNIIKSFKLRPHTARALFQLFKIVDTPSISKIQLKITLKMLSIFHAISFKN